MSQKVHRCGDSGGRTQTGRKCRARVSGAGDRCAKHPEFESPFGHIQHPKKRAYLAALVEAGGNVTRACALAEIDRSTPYTSQWLDDPAFQEALESARLMAADHLEAEAVRRAYEGVREPVGFYKGEPSTYARKYSDTLLIFLLNGAKPEKYVKRHEHSGPAGGPIPITEVRHHFDPDQPSENGNGDGS